MGTEAFDFLDWIKVVEIPVLLGMAGLILHHMWSDNTKDAEHTSNLHASSAELRAELARVELETTKAAAKAAQELADYKLAALQTFVTERAMAETEGRITRQIEQVARKLDKLLEKE